MTAQPQEHSLGHSPPLPDFASYSLTDSTAPDSGNALYAAADLSRPEYTLRVQDMPEEDRPRERLFHHGPKALSTAELLSILFGTGNGSTGLSSVGLAQAVLQVLRDGDGDVMEKLQRVTVDDLLHISGIGPAKAATLVASIELGKRVFNRVPVQRTVIDDPAVAVAALTQHLMWETREHFAVVCLNIRHQLLTTKVLTRGTETETLANPRDIFGEALRGGAVRIIVAHNHPSGNLEPSPEDLSLTQQLLKSAKIIGIPVLDHLILGGGNFCSLRQTTTLWQEDPQE